MCTTFIGDDYNFLYREILTHINNRSYDMPQKELDIIGLEICPLFFKLTNPLNRFVWSRKRGTNYAFAMKYWLWLLSGSDDFDYVARDNKHAIDYADIEEGKSVPKNFNTAYGPRIVKQLPYILKELVANPLSRRATIQILESKDLELLEPKRLGTTNTEFPCADSITFNLRHSERYGGLELNCFVNFRSNNMVKTICYDVFLFTMLQEYIYRMLSIHIENLRLGTYNHYIVSAHILKEDWDFVEEILDCKDIGMVRSDVNQEHKGNKDN